MVHHRRTSLRPRSAIYGPYKTEPHPLVGGLHKGQVSRSGVDSEDEEEDSGKEDEQENEADSEDSEDGKAENIQKQEASAREGSEVELMITNWVLVCSQQSRPVKTKWMFNHLTFRKFGVLAALIVGSNL